MLLFSRRRVRSEKVFSNWSSLDPAGGQDKVFFPNAPSSCHASSCPSLSLWKEIPLFVFLKWWSAACDSCDPHHDHHHDADDFMMTSRDQSLWFVLPFFVIHLSCPLTRRESSFKVTLLHLDSFARNLLKADSLWGGHWKEVKKRPKWTVVRIQPRK